MKIISDKIARGKARYATAMLGAVAVVLLLAPVGVFISLNNYNTHSLRRELIAMQQSYLDKLNASIESVDLSLVTVRSLHRIQALDAGGLDSLFAETNAVVMLKKGDNTSDSVIAYCNDEPCDSSENRDDGLVSQAVNCISFAESLDSDLRLAGCLPLQSKRGDETCTFKPDVRHTFSLQSGDGTISFEWVRTGKFTVGKSVIRKLQDGLIIIETEVLGPVPAILRTTVAEQCLVSPVPVLPFAALSLLIALIVFGVLYYDRVVYQTVLKRIVTMNKIIHQEWIDAKEFQSLRSSDEIGAFVDSFQEKSRQLHRQIELEQLLRGISKMITLMTEDTYEQSIAEALRELGLFSHADRTYLFLKNENSAQFYMAAHWERKGVPERSVDSESTSYGFFWFSEQIHENRHLFLESLEDIPGTANAERCFWQSGNADDLRILTTTLQGMWLKGDLIGFVGSEQLIGKEENNDVTLQVIEQFAEVFATGIDRFRTDRLVKIQNQQLLQAQKMETVGHLAGGIAHDFNNILAGIVSITSLFKMEHKDDITLSREVFWPFIDTVQEAGNRAAKVVQQLLLLSRKQEYNFAVIDLKQVIQSALNIAIPSVDKRIEFREKLCEGNAVAMADFVQIEQVVLNFFMNSVHAMTVMRKDSATFGGTLTVELSRQIVDKAFRKLHHSAFERSYWKISISDTGVGIPRENYSKIFDPFFTTKAKGIGTGLGLSMIYRIIQEHFGFVEFESEVGVGTTFNIYIPEEFSELAGDSSAKQNDSEGDAPLQATILVVDDEPVLRTIAGKILESSGHTVLFAENGGEAVDLFELHSGTIDLVILDLVMPILGGKETYLELVKIQPDIAVLISSGFRKDERVDELIAMGVAGFLQKPYTVEDMKCAVGTILKRKLSGTDRATTPLPDRGQET